MKLRKSLQLVIFLMLLSCNNSTEIVSGIAIPSDLCLYLKSKSIKDDYEQLLKKSLNNEKISIITISTLDVNSSATIQHGSVLLSIIKKIGVNNFMSAIKNCNIRQKEIIYENLQGGFDWSTDKIFKDKSLKIVYPQLYEFLQK